ncbi:Na+-transporting NADH:ubiquinone oxidoreductase subunit C [Desulfosalsimonas propionicica]|uniref:Na(+)-translocating NADH-quinone reductase subunit C n=1 Tax=Desulfosalsimonas propionicica TaxID=332175 RepID=A0A7W0C630_9BACT|nr:NADH:ubiquinone reductase (Na(+)-transporting) subunit C [Desulfosalsimonas propionicica]MBA2879715.1 Na+-transporting NADH:ubiquinone oxidoreductase subunit C [Desulfosalsimonas propionicica]
MSETLKSIGFALGMCLVCGVLLTAAATGLQPMQEKNRLSDRQKNVLYTVDLASRDKAYTPEQIRDIYEKNIDKIRVSAAGEIAEPAEDKAGDGQVLTIYLYTKNGEIQNYIIPIESQGLWGKIYGYMALENDGSTVAGFTVYEHSETPGLGGEIEKQWFQENFEGKKIVDRTGRFVAVQIAKGDVDKRVPEEKESHYVDGISGATLTGRYLSKGLEKTLSRYEPVSLCFRKQRLSCRLQEPTDPGEK